MHFSGSFIKDQTAVGTFLLAFAAAFADILLNVWFAAAVLVFLSGSGTAAHSDIFDRSAKTGHFMAFKMGQTDKYVSIHDGTADLCFFYIFSAIDRYGYIICTL